MRCYHRGVVRGLLLELSGHRIVLWSRDETNRLRSGCGCLPLSRVFSRTGSRVKAAIKALACLTGGMSWPPEYLWFGTVERVESGIGPLGVSVCCIIRALCCVMRRKAYIGRPIASECETLLYPLILASEKCGGRIFVLAGRIVCLYYGFMCLSGTEWVDMVSFMKGRRC